MEIYFLRRNETRRIDVTKYNEQKNKNALVKANLAFSGAFCDKRSLFRAKERRIDKKCLHFGGCAAIIIIEIKRKKCRNSCKERSEMKVDGIRQTHLFAVFIKRVIAVVVSLMVLAIQIAFWVMVFAFREVWYARYIIAFIGLIVVLRMYSRDTNEGIKLSWTIVILVMPFAGPLLYYFFGNGRNLPRKKEKRVTEYLSGKVPTTNAVESLSLSDERGAMLARSLRAHSGYPLYAAEKLTYYSDISKKHAQLLEDLEGAREYIYIEFFIISDGEVLESVLDVLERKGRAGVKIKFMYDDIGSKKALSKKTKRRIASIDNCCLCVYEPATITINPRMNYRDHRKIVVVDGKIGYVGGDNLADEYVNRKVRFGHWRDNAMRLTGSAVRSLEMIFAETWYLSCGEFIEFSPQNDNAEGACDGGFVMPFGDGPVNRQNPSYKLFESLMASAQKTLYISTPYLIIDNSFINMLKLAARSGVDVRLLVPHIPDKKLIFKMTRGHYGKVLKSGVRVYEYTPGFNHAKNVIVDGKYAFIGTVNCDYRSMLLHYECGALVMHDDVIAEMQDDFSDALSSSHEITYEEWRNRPLHARMVEVLLSLFAPML